MFPRFTTITKRLPSGENCATRCLKKRYRALPTVVIPIASATVTGRVESTPGVDTKRLTIWARAAGAAMPQAQQRALSDNRTDLSFSMVLARVDDRTGPLTFPAEGDVCQCCTSIAHVCPDDYAPWHRGLVVV